MDALSGQIAPMSMPDNVFTEVFRLNAPSLFRYLVRLSGDADVAADLMQETFMRLYDRGSLPADVRAWLTTVATNLLRDDRRTAARRTHLADRFNADAMPSASPQPDALAEAHERRDAVRAALATLPERDRQLLLLRHEGFSYHEIAAAVGVAASSVGTLLVRATAAFHAECTERLDAHA